MRSKKNGPLCIGAVDKGDDTLDFYLSLTRTTKVAKRCLGKAVKRLRG